MSYHTNTLTVCLMLKVHTVTNKQWITKCLCFCQTGHGLQTQWISSNSWCG